MPADFQNKNLIDVEKRVNADLERVCRNVEYRINADGIRAAIEKAKKRHPKQVLYYLTDTHYAFDELNKLDSIQEINPRGKIFICAFYSDELGSKIVREIMRKGGRYFTPEQYEPAAHYLHKNELARKIILEDFDRSKREALSHFDWRDFSNLIQAIEVTRGLAGDIVEIGVFRGTSSRTILHYVKQARIHKKCYLLDTFEGFAYEAAKKSSDSHWWNTHVDAPYDSVRERLSEFKGAVDYELIKANICEDHLPKKIKRISVCSIDVDMYEAVLAALKKVAPLMARRGIIVAEDPGHTPALMGAQVAVENFLATKLGRQFMPIYLESGQFFLIRMDAL